MQIGVGCEEQQNKFRISCRTVCIRILIAEEKMKQLFVVCLLMSGLSGAAFGQHAYIVTVNIDGIGDGSVQGTVKDPTTGHIATFLFCDFKAPNTHSGTCQIERFENDVETLTAKPAAGHTFAGWRSGTGSLASCTGTNPCIITLKDHSTITASFIPPSVLTVTAPDLGKVTFPNNNTTITVNSGTTVTKAFLMNSQVTLTASPNSGSVFTNWSLVSGSPAGSMCNLSVNPCSFTIDKQITVKPNFTNHYSLTVSKTGSGSGTVVDNLGQVNCGSDCSGTFNVGASVLLTAKPAFGTTFRKWTNGTGAATACNNLTKFCTFTASQNSSITAVFDLTQ